MGRMIPKILKFLKKFLKIEITVSKHESCQHVAVIDIKTELNGQHIQFSKSLCLDYTFETVKDKDRSWFIEHCILKLLYSHLQTIGVSFIGDDYNIILQPGNEQILSKLQEIYLTP